MVYKQQLVGDKVLGTVGAYTGCNHEILTIWTKGSCTPDITRDLPDSVQPVRKSDEHSEKPEDFRRIVEKLYATGPYLELFSTVNLIATTGAVAPTLAGLTRDHTGSFLPFFIALSIAVAIVMLAVAFMRPPHRSGA